MSVMWEDDVKYAAGFGYDGDNIHGQIVVNYWQDLDEMVADIDRQMVEIRSRAIDKYGYLISESCGP